MKSGNNQSYTRREMEQNATQRAARQNELLGYLRHVHDTPAAASAMEAASPGWSDRARAMFRANDAVGHGRRPPGFLFSGRYGDPIKRLREILDTPAAVTAMQAADPGWPERMQSVLQPNAALRALEQDPDGFTKFFGKIP